MRAFIRHLAFLLPLLSLTPLMAQVENEAALRAFGRTQPFHFDVLNMAQYDEFGMSGRVDVYVQVPIDVVKFIRKGDAYAGSFTVSVLITNDDGALIREESWERTLEQATFEGTVKPGASDVSHKAISLDPGDYQFELILEDRVSGRDFRQTKKIHVRKFEANTFNASDILLVGSVEEKNGRKQVAPQINPNLVGLSQGISLLYELYNPFEIGAVRILYRVKKRYELAIAQSETQRVRRGANSFLTTIGAENLSVGSYTLEMTVTRTDDTTETGVLARATKQFIIEWLSAGSPVSIADLDEAIEQMKYFASSDDIDHIMDAPDEKEKKARFEAFWEMRNPEPGAKSNRAMIEYYRRVAYANETFKHYIDGWKTDRGMVYIIYGAPSAVDRHPMDVETKPYEVWEFYDIAKRFVFVDESGFGDYRLLYPIWDERNRMR